MPVGVESRCLSDQSVSYAAVALNPLAFPDLVVSKW